VRAIIESGCRSGQFGTDAARLASFAVLEMGNNAKAWYNPRGPLSDTQVAEQYAEFALRIVADRGPANRNGKRQAVLHRGALERGGRKGPGSTQR